MADKLTVVVGTAANEGCGDADAALAPSRHTRAATSGGVAEKISTRVPADASALPGSGIKQAGVREWWGNFWNGVSVAAKIMTESVTVTAQVAGSPTAYVREFKDKAGNVVFSITVDTAKTLFTFYDQVTAATTLLLPSFTYNGTTGAWLVQMTNAILGIYNRAWTTGSGVPAIIHRAFDDAVASDVLIEDQDDDGTALHRVMGDGGTETAVKTEGGGLIETVAHASYNDAAVHALWTSEALAEKGALVVEILVIAEKSTGAKRARFKQIATFYRESGGTILLQDVIDTTGTDGMNPPTWLVTMTPDLANNWMTVDVQTTVAENVTWKACVRKLRIVLG